MKARTRLAILGAGNIGCSIARGLVQSGTFSVGNVLLTRRKMHLLQKLAEEGFVVESDNDNAVRSSDVVVVAVEPQQVNRLLKDITPALDRDKHTVISVVSDVSIRQIRTVIGKNMRIVRAMPNTAIAIRESMTCLAADDRNSPEIGIAEDIFKTVGRILVIDEEQMIAATALGACGVAFFLRAIRSASQGGIEIGFHADQALFIAAQTARGAASLLLSMENHPEYEIDKVTTPRGCTIAGLNRMEHAGFSSALIRGIVSSAEKASKLYRANENETT
ncbi:MAG: pyrroline-5-carboxylate reductase [Candidatus Krumholzibacteria bacterium]|nr:pyrroline-5-carboxylate reductase [Candidatus Krumholzibacteria bacterium]MDH3380283.1 pyrroline-5-carboxylate reductase [Gammaproteobacteria bacterium]